MCLLCVHALQQFKRWYARVARHVTRFHVTLPACLTVCPTSIECAQTAAHAAVHAELGFYAHEWAEDFGRAAVDCALRGDVAAARADLKIMMDAWRGVCGVIAQLTDVMLYSF